MERLMHKTQNLFFVTFDGALHTGGTGFWNLPDCKIEEQTPTAAVARPRQQQLKKTTAKRIRAPRNVFDLPIKTPDFPKMKIRGF
ncbi:MAG TPA: hypothetical protein PLO67_15305 [Saprospiraceae bacterium]|nr:hypothetical protein [Saprospiraceae bacterium]HPI06246.1 hypothetical protein [Saprospiraceae bacterium]